MLLSSLRVATHATSHAIQHVTSGIQRKFGKVEHVGDLHRETVASYDQQSLSRRDGTKRNCMRRIPLYSKFLIKSMAEEPKRSWDLVDILPRFFAFNADGQLLGDVVCLHMEEDALQNDLRRLLRMIGTASVNDDSVHIGFLVGNGFQIFTTMGESGDDFIRQVRGFHALMGRRPDYIE